MADVLHKRLYSSLNKAMRQYGLIADGDKILVGLSGGKDSLALVRLLSERARVRVPQFSVEALHVRIEEVEYESDTSYLESFCQDCGVPLHITTVSLAAASDERKAQKNISPCFFCSWNRRKALFNKAQELGCNKIALGHHRDDIIHTTLLNLFYQGQFDTMPAKLQLRKMPLTIIRPFCLIDEKDLTEYAAALHFRKQTKLCPHEHESNRTTMAAIFRQIEEQNPEARYCVMRALENAKKLVQE